MKVKFANRIYEVLFTKEFAGLTMYAVEDEPNHIDWLINVEVIDAEKKELNKIEQKPTDIQSIEKRAYEVFPDDDDENTPLYRQAFIDGAVDYIDCGCKKSSAWSEEDEEQVRQIERIVHNEGYSQKLQKQIADWLKSLKDRVQPQPKQEWNEEDDYNLQCCIAKVQYDIDNGRIGRNRELLTWLKALKDRYIWKPSDEQMWALSTLANIPESASDTCKKTAQELLEQLKKLRGK